MQIDKLSHYSTLQAMYIEYDQKKYYVISYLHRVSGYPVKKIRLQAIKDGFFTTWSGLTYGLVSKYLPENSEETAAGHLHRQRQGIRSTRVPVVNETKADPVGTSIHY